MAHYRKMYSEEREKNVRLQRELEQMRETRDNYLAFIRDGREEEFLRWYAEHIGMSEGSRQSIHRALDRLHQ